MSKASVKHWVGYDDTGRPINVPAIDIKNPSVWYRHDGYGGISPFFTVWCDKRVGQKLILETCGRTAEMKPYIRKSTDVFRYSMERLRKVPEIQFDDAPPYRAKVAETTDLVIQPFSVAKNRPRSTLTERRKIFKYIKAILAEESSWEQRVAVYEKSCEATMGILFFYEHTTEDGL